MHMLAAQSCPPRTLHLWLEVVSIRAVAQIDPGRTLAVKDPGSVLVIFSGSIASPVSVFLHSPYDVHQHRRAWSGQACAGAE